MSDKLPKEILVYQCHEHGESYFVVAQDVDEILEEQDGNKVGVYTLKRVDTFRVTRELKK
jgi:hypothetical protein